MAALGTTGIGAYEVGNAIGLGVGDFGLLCADLQVVTVDGVTSAVVPHVQAGRINMFAKYKPVKWAHVLNAYTEKGANRYLGDNNNCGIKFIDPSGGIMTGTLEISYINTIANYNWAYDNHEPSETYPAEISAFMQYNHAARPIIRSKIASGGRLNVNLFNYAGGTGTLTHFYWLNTDEATAEDYELTIADLVTAGVNMQPFNPTNFYLAFRIKNQAGTSSSIIIQQEKLATETSPALDIPVGTGVASTLGDYTIDAFLGDGYHTDPEIAEGLLEHIIPLWQNAQNVNHFTLRVESFFPGSTSIIGVGASLGFVPGDAGDNLVSLVTYQHPDYYDEYYNTNSLPTNAFQNIVFKILITPTQNITLTRSEFKIYTNVNVQKNLFVQIVGGAYNETYAPSPAGSITLVSGVAYTVYLMYSPSPPSPITDGVSTTQFFLSIRNAIIYQSGWLYVDDSLTP